jgi:hypothetical protein
VFLVNKMISFWAIVFLFFSVAYKYFHDIPTGDMAFAIGYPSYVLLANLIRFDNNRPAKETPGKEKMGLNFETDEEKKKGDAKKFFKKYIGSFALSGLLLPLLLMVAATSQQGYQSETARIAAPHLFLLLAQICTERLSSYLDCHGYIKCLIPIGFSVYRQGALLRWLGAAYALVAKNGNGSGAGIYSWLELAGFILSALNTMIWTYNTFIFLLLRMMPTFLDSERYPIATVEWKGQLIPVVVVEGKKTS